MPDATIEVDPQRAPRWPDRRLTALLFGQGLVQVLEAAVTGLEPGRPYVLALSGCTDGGGALEALASFMTNLAGAAVVNAVGLIRQLVQGEVDAPQRYLVIAPGMAAHLSEPVQVQAP